MRQLPFILPVLFMNGCTSLFLALPTGQQAVMHAKQARAISCQLPERERIPVRLELAAMKIDTTNTCDAFGTNVISGN